MIKLKYTAALFCAFTFIFHFGCVPPEQPSVGERVLNLRFSPDNTQTVAVLGTTVNVAWDQDNGPNSGTGDDAQGYLLGYNGSEYHVAASGAAVLTQTGVDVSVQGLTTFTLSSYSGFNTTTQTVSGSVYATETLELWVGELVINADGDQFPDQLEARGSVTLANLNNDGVQDYIVATSGGGVEYWIGKQTAGGQTVIVQVEGQQTGSADPAPTPISDPDPSVVGETVSATKGVFRVTEGGTASYSMPIYTPEGTAGVTPGIALSYNSGGANDLIGLGWSLGGFSKVVRCSQSRGIDDFWRGVNFTDTDRLCLDGQRLVPADGDNSNYWSNGKEYRLLIDGYSRIFLKLVSNTWQIEVHSKDGTVKKYTPTLFNCSGDCTGTHAIGAWKIDTIEDNLGNRIDFEYDSSCGVSGNYCEGYVSTRPKSVKYAYGAGSTPGAQIDFYYEVRNDRPARRYLGGLEFPSAAVDDGRLHNHDGNGFGDAVRLSRIEIQNNSQHVKTYHLDYRDDDTNYTVSRLERIKECADQATTYASSTNCLPPTTFSWYAPDNQDEVLGTYDGNWQGSEDKIYPQIGDFNGDGKQDIAFLTVDYQSDDQDWYLDVHLSDGNTLNYSQGLGNVYDENQPRKIQVIDYNNDGYSDLLRTDGSGNWLVHLSQGATGILSGPINIGIDYDKWWGWQTLKQFDVYYDQDADGLISIDQHPIERYLENGEWKYRPKQNWPGLTLGVCKPFAIADHETQNQQYAHFPYLENIESNCDPDYSLRTFIRDTYDTNWDINGDVTPLTTFMVGDFTGDGAVDFAFLSAVVRYPPIGGQPQLLSTVRLTVWSTENPYTHNVFYLDDVIENNLPLASSHIWQNYRNRIASADFNRDGLTDVIIQKAGVWTLYHSTGQSFKAITTFTGLASTKYLQIQDYNGDGFADLIYPSGSNYVVRLYNSNSQTFEPAINTNIGYAGDDDGQTYTFLDIDGDSRLDHIRISVPYAGENHSGSHPTSLAIYKRQSATQGLHNLIYRIDNGMNTQTDIEYTSLSDSSVYEMPESMATANDQHWEYDYYVDRTPKDYTVFDIRRPVGFAVSRVETHTAIGVEGVSSITATEVQSAVSYKYYGLKAQGAGRGSLGFEKVESIDEQSGILTETWYRQDFPFIGRAWKTITKRELPNDTYRLVKANRVGYQLRDYTSDAPLPAPPYLIEAAKTEEIQYDPDASVETVLSTVETSTQLDAWGNTETLTVTTWEGEKSAGVEAFTQSTVNTYINAMLGRLSTTTVTFQRPNDTKTRLTSFEYYPAGHPHENMLMKSTVNPGDPLALETEIEYDSFGNKAKVITRGRSGKDGSSPLQTRYERNVYEAGRYLKSSYRLYPSGEQMVQNVIARDKFGQPTIVNSINGGQVRKKYDAFGFNYHTYKNTGEWQTIRRYKLGNSRHETYRIVVEDSTGAYSDTTYNNHDQETTKQYSVFGANVATVKTFYDASGRVMYKSDPTYTSYDYTHFAYDDLGRLRTVTHPDATTTVTDYSGLTKTITNRLGQQRIETNNVLGELVSVVDELNGYVGYDYDATGNVTATKTGTKTGSSINLFTTISVDYDAYGRKSSLDDPDKGYWTYHHNAFGELVEQTDAMQNTTQITYDIVGRKSGRIDQNGDITTWTYDLAELDANNCWGQLTKVEHNDNYVDPVPQNNLNGRIDSAYVKRIACDDYGRFSREETTIDGETYETKRVTYTAVGQTFQVFDASGGFNGIQLSYDAVGFLVAVDEANAESQFNRYLQVTDVNARGQVETTEFGTSAYTQSKVYNSISGYLETISTSNGLDNVQRLDMRWDALGNLEYREDTSEGRDEKEAYCYDELNRLVHVASDTTSVNCGGIAAYAYAYDNYGRILSKNGNAYTYHATKVHAVSTAFGNTYAYDNNGSVIGDGTRTFEYTAYDKPYRIRNANYIVDYYYGPERGRYKRIDSNGEETLYLGAVEWIKKADGTAELRRTISEQVQVIEYRNDFGQTYSEKVQYLLRDHLGSLHTVLEASGVRTSMSFDVWGKRREAHNWSDTLSWQVDTAAILALHDVTRRGYTNHEMVDQLGFIHMNGRIYDPVLSRFLQADSMIPSASYLQSYDRYAYVYNNPLNATDPDGHHPAVTAFWVAYAVMGAYIAGQALEEPWLVQAAVIGSCITGNAIACTAATATQSLAQTGSIGEAFRAGVLAYAQAGFSEWLGTKFKVDPGSYSWELVGKAAAHGVNAGVFNVLRDGKFGHGFASAFGMQMAAPGIMKIIPPADGGYSSIRGFGRSAIAAAAGGTISDLSGGKFANGALSAGISWAYNTEGWLKESQNNTLHKGKIHVSKRKLVDVRKEGEWNTVGAVGDIAATAVGLLPNSGAKTLAVALDAADIASVQSRDVVEGQNWENEIYEYDTYYSGTADNPKDWVEYPGVRSNPVLIKSDTEIIWRSRETQYRTCMSHNFGCSN